MNSPTPITSPTEENPFKKRYELAERTVWAKLPNWKKDAIIKSKLTGNLNSHILDEYAREIIRLADSEDVLTDKLPAVPSFTLKGKPAPEPLTT